MCQVQLITMTMGCRIYGGEGEMSQDKIDIASLAHPMRSSAAAAGDLGA